MSENRERFPAGIDFHCRVQFLEKRLAYHTRRYDYKIIHSVNDIIPFRAVPQSVAKPDEEE